MVSLVTLSMNSLPAAIPWSLIILSRILPLNAPMLFSSIVPCLSTPFLTITYALLGHSGALQTSQLRQHVALYSRLRPSGKRVLNMSFTLTHFIPFSFTIFGVFPLYFIVCNILNTSLNGMFLSLCVNKNPPDMWSCIPPIIAPPNLGERMFSWTFIKISASAFASSPCKR